MPVVDQAAPEAVKLPDPNDPRYAAARAKMANLFFAIGREDSRNGYGAMADDLMCGDLMQVPTWIALGMLAEAASLPCKSGEGADAVDARAEGRKILKAVATSPRRHEYERAAFRLIRQMDGTWYDPKEYGDDWLKVLVALTPDATQTREAEGRSGFDTEKIAQARARITVAAVKRRKTQPGPHAQVEVYIDDLAVLLGGGA